MSRVKINDGLNKWQRYRLKDVEAYRKKKAAYARTPEEKSKRVAYMRNWREKNRERHNELARQSHQRNKYKHVGKMRKYLLKAKYGITEEEFNKMLENQGGRCKICNSERKGRYNFHVDHCHKTGRVRGLLCSNCNTTLGFYETRLEKIKDKILEYLK